MKKKFLRILKDNSKKLYIYKIRKNDINSEINYKILELNKALKSSGSGEVDLLVVVEKRYKNIFLQNGEYYVRYVTSYPPDNKVTSWKYNRNGFKKVFDEFYFIKPKNKVNKKVYKFEQQNKEY